jgi:hypothetical protein
MWPFTSKWELVEANIEGVRSFYFPSAGLDSTYRKERVVFDKYRRKKFNGTYEYKRVITSVDSDNLLLRK